MPASKPSAAEIRESHGFVRVAAVSPELVLGHPGKNAVIMAKEAEQVSIQVEAATRERQKVGFGTQLELNLTTAEGGRARHDRLDAERKYDTALAELASAIGAKASEVLEPTGTLALTPGCLWLFM